MQAQVAGREAPHDVFHISSMLASAHCPNSNEWLGRQADPRPLVEVGAALVVREGPALQDRHEGEVWRQFAKADEVAHGAPLVLADGQAGPFEDVLFAHPVLGCRPHEVPDLGGVAADGADVAVLVGVPAPVELQLGEPAGVERPFGDGPGQDAAVAEPPV
ncbi:hypothetical protein LWC34_53995 [Kibdelosporangium philippinense]|uniref:Uncharacterized protein n=1 Tax=Kibdelosporangium philippinense TaxID=211113 RepID=A0ABS8ZVB1_9PSEU|nr:hypothetical protein [Kibdelosporangium philippinense]MCE7011670.1 hypothetical protein [Kibdelosporangium philippinense]